ncbi:MAG TPA: energy transducer TonB [Terracidiphilus sp.]|jgi:protein TonB|nr:energy transducer TonB [Terracidiphilus sp.]
MFEDSTFESTGRIQTRSRGWTVATFLLNGSVLFGLILIPLIYPEALPRQALAFLLTAPAPPPAPQEPPKQPPQKFRGTSEMPNGVILAPPKIPSGIFVGAVPEQAPGESIFSMDQGSGMPDAGTGVFPGRHAASVVRGEPKGPVRISSGVMEGSLLAKFVPVYPAIAKAAGAHGTVVLQATISKNGTIENLRVVSGPMLLQQAAMDAVKTWRYRPYLLNGEPVEVETTVNVVFDLDRQVYDRVNVSVEVRGLPPFREKKSERWGTEDGAEARSHAPSSLTE